MNQDGPSLIIDVFCCFSSDILTLLIVRGCNVLALNNDQATPLHVAASDGNVKYVHIITLPINRINIITLLITILFIIILPIWMYHLVNFQYIIICWYYRLHVLSFLTIYPHPQIIIIC